MPLIYQENISDGVRLYVWQVDEPLEWFLPSLTSEDLRSLEGITSLTRRTERAVWRYLVRKFVSNNTLLYNNLGAPVLKCRGCISVSHSGSYVVVIHSDETPCGVDIESLDRKFQRVSNRYISAVELELNDVQRSDFLAVVWTAKEALYKISGLKELDFIRDLQIVDSDLNNQYLRGMVRGKQFDLSVRRIDDYVMTFVK